ncbi:MAG: glycosyltransferase [Candidatus Binatia bacterium]
MAKRIIVAGSIESHPLAGAGNTWAFLQYVLGFRRLGFETYYVEQLSPQDCIDDNENRTNFRASANVRHFRALMENFNLLEQASLLDSSGTGHVGLSRAEVETLARDVDLLVNISGRLNFVSIVGAVRRRMYLDMDPGYTQIWQEQYGVDMNLRGHDVYVTIGLNLGKPDCPLPTCGIRWEKTLPPVVLEEWQTTLPPGKNYSTIADWRGFEPVQWRGVWYGQKADEFKRIIKLPHRVAVPLELCLFIHPDESDRVALETQGWRLVSPAVHAATTDAYRDYVIGSRGEFTAVKQGYAAGRTGWFSDRSACYLAAGRPVVMQDTGLGAYLPTGSGLLTFKDIDGAAAALDQVETAYAKHSAAAASFAREFLDSDRVLSRLMELAGVG